MPCVLQISSIIEIEVEMDSDVLAAEAAGNAVRIIFVIILTLFKSYSEVVIQLFKMGNGTKNVNTSQNVVGIGGAVYPYLVFVVHIAL